MKIFFISFTFLFTVISFNTIAAQTNYSLGISTGIGLNFYRNYYSTDENHFKFTSPITPFLGLKLIKRLDEKNNFFTEILYSAKKIEFKYNINEPEIPLNNEDIISQKYASLSMYFGYRRVIEKYTHALFFDASFGADYNSNVMISGRGNGEATAEISETIYYEGGGNTNLGEKSFTLSGNLGFGCLFGARNQYEIATFINIPLHKIQTEPSNFYYIWMYKNKEYVHQLNYFGVVYYPSVKLTYYIF